jgi:hypothetical protein
VMELPRYAAGMTPPPLPHSWWVEMLLGTTSTN